MITLAASDDAGQLDSEVREVDQPAIAVLELHDAARGLAFLGTGVDVRVRGGIVDVEDGNLITRNYTIGGREGDWIGRGVSREK